MNVLGLLFLSLIQNYQSYSSRLGFNKYFLVETIACKLVTDEELTTEGKRFTCECGLVAQVVRALH